MQTNLGFESLGISSGQAEAFQPAFSKCLLLPEPGKRLFHCFNSIAASLNVANPTCSSLWHAPTPAMLQEPPPGASPPWNAGAGMFPALQPGPWTALGVLKQQIQALHLGWFILKCTAGTLAYGSGSVHTQNVPLPPPELPFWSLAGRAAPRWHL